MRPPSNGGGSAAGPRGSTGGTNTGYTGGGVTQPTIMNRPVMPPRALIMPPIMPSATDNQQPLYMLANGTGGFVIVNTNDLLGGLEKIGKEQNEHYMIGYSPGNFEEGKCHTLKVKVTQSGMTVRARTGYCDAKPTDLLNGNPTEKDLEKVILSANPGTVTGATMQAPYFYTSPNSARMNVALEIPSSAVKFEKHKGKYSGQLNVLGVVYRPDGAVAARFSDTLKYHFDDKKSMEAWQENPTIGYEKDVDGVPGKYTLKMVVGSNSASFAKIEMPISIDPYDGSKFSLSGLAFATRMRKINQTDANLDSAMSEDRTPLIVNGLQLFPSGRGSFKKTETVALYAELYEPANAAAEPPKDLAAAIQMRLLDAKGKVRIDSGLMRTPFKAGSPVAPLALKVPVDQLEPGTYVCELTGADTLGGQVRRVANFVIE